MTWVRIILSNDRNPFVWIIAEFFNKKGKGWWLTLHFSSRNRSRKQNLSNSSCLFVLPENYRFQSAYENNLIIKMVFVSYPVLFCGLFFRIVWFSISSYVFLFFTVWIHQFLPQSFLHWILSQGHGATEGGKNFEENLKFEIGRTKKQFSSCYLFWNMSQFWALAKLCQPCRLIQFSSVYLYSASSQHMSSPGTLQN